MDFLRVGAVCDAWYYGGKLTKTVDDHVTGTIFFYIFNIFRVSSERYLSKGTFSGAVSVNLANWVNIPLPRSWSSL